MDGEFGDGLEVRRNREAVEDDVLDRGFVVERRGVFICFKMDKDSVELDTVVICHFNHVDTIDDIVGEHDANLLLGGAERRAFDADGSHGVAFEVL